jgi:hypothetical protein
MISDTTIAATQSLGCDLKDKFKINHCISRSSDYRNLIFYLGLNSDIVTVDLPKVGFEWIPIIPYILVIALALWSKCVFYFNWDGFSRCHRLYWRIFSFTGLSKKHMKDLLV